MQKLSLTSILATLAALSATGIAACGSGTPAPESAATAKEVPAEVTSEAPTTRRNTMTSKKSVLSVGVQPQLIDFADPAYAAYPGMTAEKVQGGLDKDVAALNAIGYDAQLCLTDFGETAEAVIRATLQQKRYDCVVIGAGMRTIGKNFLLFEKVLNVVHEHAPQARICFNTGPFDTAEAVQRCCLLG